MRFSFLSAAIAILLPLLNTVRAHDLTTIIRVEVVFEINLLQSTPNIRYELDGQSVIHIRASNGSDFYVDALDGITQANGTVEFFANNPPQFVSEYFSFSYFGILRRFDTVLNQEIGVDFIIASGTDGAENKTTEQMLSEQGYPMLGGMIPTESLIVNSLTTSMNSPVFMELQDFIGSAPNDFSESINYGEPGLDPKIALHAFFGPGDTGVYVGDVRVYAFRPIPEPSSVALLCAACGGVLIHRRWRVCQNSRRSG